jgi:hypothetical protein
MNLLSNHRQIDSYIPFLCILSAADRLIKLMKDYVVSLYVNNRCIYKFTFSYQSLVGSVVIDAKLGREDHGSIPRNCDRKGAETT